MKLLSTEILHELRNSGVTCLYHITDRKNLSSISSCGGLCSWSYTRDHKIDVPRPCGDAVTHRLDQRRGLDRTVHLYLRKPNDDVISAYERSGRTSNPFVLEIEIEALKPGTQFSVGDPYRVENEEQTDVSFADDVVASKVEIHVPDFIPLKYMRNMPEKYTASISSNNTTAVIFIIDQSESMSQATELNGVRYDYMSDAVASIVNRQIETMLHSCVEDGAVARKFDIAVIGYGEYPYSAWNGKLSGKGFVSPGLLMACGKPGEKYRWVDPNDSGKDSRGDLAFEQARILLEEWMSHQKNRYYYPPTVIHITDGGIPDSKLKSFLLESEAIRRLHSVDGNVLIWNFLITPEKRREFILPSGDELPALRGGGGLSLYESSSIIPESIARKLAIQLGKDPRMQRRAIGLNVSLDTLSRVLGQCILPE